MKNLKILALCLAFLPLAMLMTTVAAAGGVTITSMSLVKPEHGSAVFTITVQNMGTMPATSVTVTLDGEVPADMALPSGELQPGASVSDTLNSLTGSYLVGNMYMVSVNATYTDHGITTLTQPVICEAGQTRTAGVHPEDWFKYSITLGGNGTIPPDSWAFPFVGAEWSLVRVTDVSGTNVTEQSTRHYQNGSETTYSFWVDVNTGEYFGRSWGEFIAANLSVGDAIYTHDSNPVITATGSRAYPDGARETTYADCTEAIGSSGVA
jgi:hypothetical protein